MIWRNHAFSLVEVTLAIGLVAFALIAVVGLLPIGIQSSKDAGDDTRTSAIAQDVFNRTQGQLDSYVATNGSLPASIQTGPRFYYDVDGRYLNTFPITNYSTIATALYQAQVTYGPPAAFSGTNSNIDGTALTAVKVAVGWPVIVNVSGSSASISQASAARSIYSFYMRSTLPTPGPTP